MRDQARLYLIDGTSYIFRAYYAIRQYLSTKAGLPTNAILGFANMLIRLLEEERPEHLAIAFDPPGPSFRVDLYPEYKAHRPDPPNDLVPQFEWIYRLVEAFRIPQLVVPGYEADDALATAARWAEAQGLAVTIIGGDKDFFQLVSDRVEVYDTLKNVRYGPAEVEAKMGVAPQRIVEFLGLMGDSVDNIPGVPGVGAKTAAKLLGQFGSLEAVLAGAAEVSGAKLRENLDHYADQARLSAELCRLKDDVPLKLDITLLERQEPDWPTLTALLKELEFSSLIKRIAPHDEAPFGETPPPGAYRAVVDWEDFASVLDSLKRAGRFALDLETTSLDPMRAEVVGLALAWTEGEAVYVPVAHTGLEAPNQLERSDVLNAVGPLLADPALKKVGQNIKYDWVVLANAGVELKGVAFDTMVASYVLNPSRRQHNLAGLVLEHFNYTMTTYEDVAGKGAKQVSFDQVPIEAATAYACEDADYTLRLADELSAEVESAALAPLLYELEMPLIEVLVAMERWGVKIDAAVLRDLSKELEGQIEALATRIYTLAGEEFNIKSPVQLRAILFERLGLPVLKRTKTGPSTDHEVLEQLALQHDLPAEVVNYRALSKLKSTYVDALPALIHPATGRIHTSFNQTVTATGRLSSSDPNLQNIPVRSEVGRRIRQAFVAEEGRRLLSCDYNQIELRILAHLSKDTVLLEAFAAGEDIHNLTASEVFGVGPADVTPDQRRVAKVVNFGIIYGLSPFGLARDLKVSREEAREYIDGYFARYALVKDYIEATKAEAHERGYVTTVLGRRRYLPELASADRVTKEMAERMAVNTPIQGSAADLIKRAMVEIYGEIVERGLEAKMILQVHDELLFEVPDDEADEVENLVVDKMVGVVELDVPITVDAKWGKSWSDAH
ncbi:MAG: DNA polymerase I [Nitrospinae bacterium]|nr:DNA polymerase I [Nitrospinota bacterium]